jgi:hypothetical protein
MYQYFLKYYDTHDKRISNSYPQLHGKVEVYAKMVKNEFLAVEDISETDDGKLRYDTFIKAYNENREHRGTNGLTTSEMFSWFMEH